MMQDNGQIFDHAKLPSDINKNPVRFKAGDTKYVFPVCKTKKKKMMTPTLQRMVSWEWQNFFKNIDSAIVSLNIFDHCLK